MAPLGAPLPRWPWFLLALLLAGVMGAGLRQGMPPADAAGIPDFSLTDEGGRMFGRKDLDGRVWIAGFIFTRCAGICPVVTERMASFQASGADLVSFTVDPGFDTPEVLKAYARAHGIVPGRWHFLTGPRDPLYRLIGQGFHLAVAASSDASEPVTHSDRLVLVDRRGRLRGTYRSGEAEDMDRLRRDLETALREPAP